MAKAWILPILLLTGCVFSERSCPYDPSARAVISLPARPDGQAMTARQWLTEAASQLAHLLPHEPIAPLLTDQLVRPDGKPVDVFAHFGTDPNRLEAIFYNFSALAYSAQAIQAREPAKAAPPWEGFDDVWVPIDDDLQMAGRLGWARDSAGEIADADCIVILPGIRGDNNILRTRDLALALRRCGFHVLTVEFRGTGETDRRWPDHEYTWGIFETDDLLRAADWLQAKPHVRRTGLIAYSWGANHAILAAWAQGRTDHSQGVPPRLRPFLNPAPIGPKRYEAGMLVFSPIYRTEELMDKVVVERSVFINPALAGLQMTIRERMIERKLPNPCGSIRELIKHMGIGYDSEVADGLEYVRIMPYKDLPAHDRLGLAPMPLLIVHSVDDMISPAQGLADLIAAVDNPNIAAICLPEGGHIGFAPYAAAWYYNLILNFFDPVVGAAAR